MILESEVRDALAAVATGDLAVKRFSEWIEDESWSMHRDSSPGAVELVSSVHALLAERDAGALDGEGLKHALIDLLNNVRASWVVLEAVATGVSLWIAPEPLAQSA